MNEMSADFAAQKAEGDQRRRREEGGHRVDDDGRSKTEIC